MLPTAPINAAIRDCLDGIRPAESPLAHLAAFLDGLRADPTWTEDEIREVESALRRILTTLIEEPNGK
jgi:hypothetical protein